MLLRFARLVVLVLLVSLSSSAVSTACEVKLKEVYFRQGSFTGASGIPMKDHESGNPLPAPEWLDLNLDGDTSDEGECNEPGAFVRSTTFKVKAKFDVQGADPTTVKVWAEGEFGGLNSEASPITLNASGAGIFLINTADGTIKYHEAGVWTWKWKIGDDPTVHQMGTSSHTICVTAGSPVATPVYKWVMIPSCKSCDGLDPAGADADKQIADRLFQNFEANAKVEADLLQYDLVGFYPLGTVEDLLKKKKNACNSWANYFNHQAEAQGVATLAVRGFYLLLHTPTNFKDEKKWQVLVTEAPGVNNERPGQDWSCSTVVNSGCYAQSSTEPGATDETDVSGTPNYPDPYWAWGTDDHAVIMLQKDTKTYLYDTSFEVGPVELVGFSIPEDEAVVTYGATHVFRTQYIDNAECPFKYICGEIMVYESPGMEVRPAYVPVGDESLSPGLPTDLKFKWKDCESAN